MKLAIGITVLALMAAIAMARPHVRTSLKMVPGKRSPVLVRTMTEGDLLCEDVIFVLKFLLSTDKSNREQSVIDQVCPNYVDRAYCENFISQNFEELDDFTQNLPETKPAEDDAIKIEEKCSQI